MTMADNAQLKATMMTGAVGGTALPSGIGIIIIIAGRLKLP